MSPQHSYSLQVLLPAKPGLRYNDGPSFRVLGKSRRGCAFSATASGLHPISISYADALHVLFKDPHTATSHGWSLWDVYDGSLQRTTSVPLSLPTLPTSPLSIKWTSSHVDETKIPQIYLQTAAMLTRCARRATSPATQTLNSFRLPLSDPLQKMSTLVPKQLVEEQQLPMYSSRHYYPVRVGSILNDRYRIITKFGFGAYSTVWLAKDQR